MTPSEKYVCRLFKDRYGILLRKIDERDGIEGQSPDFEYIKNRRRVFVCELKDYDIVYPSEEAGWDIMRHPDGSEEATRESSAPNKISRNIYKAYKQLREYNEPKILIFFNKSSGLNVSDLDETLKGYFEFSAGDRKYIDCYARRASEGIIKDIKSKIDLYIWIDKANPLISGEKDVIYFRTVTDAGKEIARKHFGMVVE
jgi:hypothetical protein